MTDALAAALLASQQGQQRFDPASNSRRFAQMLMQQGTDTSPIQHPLQGVDRMAKALLGGYMNYKADADQKAGNQRLIEGLTGAMAESDPAKRMEILKGIGGDNSGVLAPFLGSMLAQQVADERKATLGAKNFNAMGTLGGAGGGGGGGGGGQPLTIDVTPLPSGTPAPGGFNNNLGNIRASNINWDGKGAPQNGFETFSTPQQGANAMFQNLSSYAKKSPAMTVADAIAKWAPPNENDTQLYIRQVAEGTGINPATPLAEVLKDQALAATLMDAMTRKEKGGLPQGVNADTFMAAAGPAQSVPGALTQSPVPAQGSSDGGAVVQTQAPTAPTAPQMPAISPQAAELEQQALAAANGGNWDRAIALRQKAQEAQAAYAGKRAETTEQRGYTEQQKATERAADAAEHDRREANKPLTKEQSDAAGFSDRMVNSERILGQTEGQGKSTKGRVLESKVLGVGIPGANYAQSEDYQKFRQARDDFINAQLRRESGAVISDQEYANADRQYFPQPGDSDAVIAQKRKNRQLSVEAMTRAAGKTYTLNETVNRPAAGTTQSTPTGAPQAGTVMDGYRFKGGDPSKQENWEPVR